MNQDAAAEVIFREGVRAVHPENLIRSAITISGGQLLICGNSYLLSSLNKIYVTGAGKASAGMAHALEEVLGNYISEGLVVVKYEHELSLKKIKQIPAAHPIPDGNSLKAAAEIHTLLKKTTEKDLVICLLSGGASALLADCPKGVSLDDLREVSDRLLRSGAAIGEINTVRKHLSTLKGGQLARCAGPSELVSLIISDVVGDDPAVIASGPTAPDASTFKESLEIIARHFPGRTGLAAGPPKAVLDHLEKGSKGVLPETPKPGDPVFSKVKNHIIGSNELALSAAARKAEQLGYHARVLGSRAEGPAEEIASFLVKEALNYKGPRPACLLLGGESTVEVHAEGKGGRNQHLTLAAALALETASGRETASGPTSDPALALEAHLNFEAARDAEVREAQGKDNITVLSAGTDGTDGPTDMAGAVAGTATLEKARRMGLHPRDFLENCDSYHFFKQVGGHIYTGPTQSNVMDLMMMLIQ